MAVLEAASQIEQLRRDLWHISPPYLLRKYDALPEDFEELAEEDLRCEYLDGVLIVHSPATFDHENRVAFLTMLLGLFVRRRDLGTVLTSNAVMQLGHRRFCPDVSFLHSRNASRVRGGRVMGPMDLTVEVLSNSTRDYDLGEKRRAYREGRVPEIWWLDPDRRQAHFDFLEQDSYSEVTLATGRMSSRVLEGLAFEVDWLWTDPLPNPLNCLGSDSP
jgi:Uma2 family endonuclease